MFDDRCLLVVVCCVLCVGCWFVGVVVGYFMIVACRLSSLFIACCCLFVGGCLVDV